MEEENLGFWLEKLNLNQKMLAKKIGVSEITILNWKKAGKLPKPSRLGNPTKNIKFRKNGYIGGIYHN